MGHHYVPRQHLRRFSSDQSAKLVWMYDKQLRKFTEAAIANVAQEPNFYEPDIEKALAEIVESPAKAAMDKLLNREQLDNSERSHLSFYFMIMRTRGPRSRREMLADYPQIAEDVYEELKGEIQEWIQEQPSNELAHKSMHELEGARSKFSVNLPPEIVEKTREPYWSSETVECIHNMCWHIIPAPADTFYLTGDTPAHFFECYGLAHPWSEFTITLSKDFALVGEYSLRPGVLYEKPQKRLVTVINQRILSLVDRFVFSHRPADWIETAACNSKPYLSRITWKAGAR